MDRNALENWLIEGKRDVIRLNNLASNWWPTTAANQQALASAWSTAFFARAALENSAGAVCTARCLAGSGNLNSQVLADRWISPPGRCHDTAQLMLDFCVTNEDAASPIQVTGESEVSPSFPVRAEPIPRNGYSWDFYKLLIVPSSTRLFFARVAADGGVRAPDRVHELACSLRQLVDRLGPALLRPNDEIGAALIPATKRDRDESLVFWVVRGRVRFEKVRPNSL